MPEPDYFRLPNKQPIPLENWALQKHGGYIGLLEKREDGVYAQLDGPGYFMAEWKQVPKDLEEMALRVAVRRPRK